MKRKKQKNKARMTNYKIVKSKKKMNKKCKTLRMPRIAKDSPSTIDQRSKKRRKVLSFKTKKNNILPLRKKSCAKLQRHRRARATRASKVN